MTLTRYGFREWGTITVACAAAGALLWHFAGPSWVIAHVVVWLALVALFRDPWGRRPATAAPNDMVSPADGRISAVLDLDHHPATGGPAKLVRIFLSVLDVHINRFPCDGTVTSAENVPGKYLDARTAESAKVNESTTMVLTTASGERIGIRQISGAIARRIVCAVRPGQSHGPAGGGSRRTGHRGGPSARASRDGPRGRRRRAGAP